MLAKILLAACGLLALVVAAGTSCSKVPRPDDGEHRQQMQDGVQVGNGLVKGQFVSKKYKYELRYDNALQPSASSFEKVRFDNSRLRKPSDAYSVVDVQVYPGGNILGRHIGTEPLLRQYLIATYPGKIFNEDMLHGLPWFFFEVDRAGFKYGWHYFLTPLDDVIFVEAVLGDNSVGAKMLADTLASLKFDATGPEILSVTVSIANSVVGERNQLKLQMTDNVVGIVPRVRGKLSLIAQSDFVDGCARSSDFSADLIGDSGDNLYRADFPIATRLCPGEYAVSQISAWDLAGNPTMLRTTSETKPDPKGKYLGAGVHSVGIAVFHVLAKPVVPDNSPPEIRTLGPAKLMAPTGATQTLTFEAADPETGVDEYRNTWGVFESNFTVEGKTATFIIFGNSTQIDSTHFALEFRVRDFLPPGQYFLREFKVANRAFKSKTKTLRAPPKPTGEATCFYGGTKIPVVFLSVSNSGLVDITPPELLSLSISTPKVKRGRKGTIEFTAKDEGTGISDYFEFGGLFMPLFGGGVGTLPVSGIYVDGPVKKWNGKHVLDIFIDAETAVGTYALQVFHTWDGADNFDETAFVDITTLMNNPGAWLNRFYATSSKTRLPLQFLEVITD